MNNKRKVAVISLIVCLVAIISMGSLAWFTANDYVDNNLKFVTSFEMDLIEHDGSKVVGKGSDHTGLTFKNVKPGSVLAKDPTVLNKSKNEAQWIKMTVMVDNAANWAKVVSADTDLTTIFTGYVDDLWFHPEDPTIDASGNYVATFYLKNKLQAGNSQTLFTGVKIPTTMTIEDAKAIQNSHIVVKAEAMQAEAGGDVLEAFGVK